MPTPGKLDRYIELQSVSTTKDAANQPVESWSKVTDVWASFRFRKGSEVFEAGTTEAETMIEVELRERSDIEPTTHRFKDGSDVWDIDSVLGRGERTGYMRVAAVKHS